MNRCIAIPEVPKLQDSKTVSVDAESARTLNLVPFPHSLAPNETFAASKVSVWVGWKADLAYPKRRSTQTQAATIYLSNGDPSRLVLFRRAVLHRRDEERQRDRAGLILGRLVKPPRIGYSSVQNRVGGSGMK